MSGMTYLSKLMTWLSSLVERVPNPDNIGTGSGIPFTGESNIFECGPSAMVVNAMKEVSVATILRTLYGETDVVEDDYLEIDVLAGGGTIEAVRGELIIFAVYGQLDIVSTHDDASEIAATAVVQFLTSEDTPVGDPITVPVTGCPHGAHKVLVFTILSMSVRTGVKATVTQLTAATGYTLPGTDGSLVLGYGPYTPT